MTTTATTTAYRTPGTNGTGTAADPQPAGTAAHGWMSLLRARFTLGSRSRHDLVGRHRAHRAHEAAHRLTLDVPSMRF
jgi:hypothetical protein